MAVRNLTVRAQLDAAGVTRGVQDVVRQFSGIRQQIQGAVGSQSFLPDMREQGNRAAQELVDGLKAAFRQQQAAIREQLFAGTINRAEARRRGLDAGVEMTRGLQAGMAELERRIEEVTTIARASPPTIRRR